MLAHEILSGGSKRLADGDGGAVLRHANGSINVAAYAAMAHRQRAAAIASSIQSAVRRLRDAWQAIALRRDHQRTAAAKPCG
ncbi:hypothetical protein V1277_001255 [Bradyrhizobium sp. AZCC 1588]|uniref:hypothetical protein n=1 Tax=unclassified Bradyrhizobium TaxID=2631580 RepID=UPI002FEEAD89